MKFDIIIINEVLFYLKDINAHKCYRIMLIFYLMLNDNKNYKF